MLAFFQSLVVLPEPIHIALVAAFTLLLGLAVKEIAKLSPGLATFLGEYIDEVAFVFAGGIVTWVNGYLAQIPANWEGVGNAALTLVVAVLVALGLVGQARKARARAK